MARHSGTIGVLAVLENVPMLGLQADFLSATNQAPGIVFFSSSPPKVIKTDIPVEELLCFRSVSLRFRCMLILELGNPCLVRALLSLTCCLAKWRLQVLQEPSRFMGVGLPFFSTMTTLVSWLWVLRVHNCLSGRGQFNLLSVSQVCQQKGNSVDFTLASPALVLRGSGSKTRTFRLPLFLEDGLFALRVTPFQLDDLRYSTLPKVDVAPSGVFQLSDESSHRWSSKVLLTASREARILVSSHSPPSGNP